MVRDIAFGVQPPGELDFARRCRQRGLPQPDRLDVTIDDLRRNALVLAGDRVLRITVIGLRLESSLFLDQVAAGHRGSRCRSM